MAEATETLTLVSKTVQKKPIESKHSPKRGIPRTKSKAPYRPKTPKKTKVTKRVKVKLVNHERTRDVLIFCVFRSDHLELRKTVPKLATVALNLLLRSKKMRRAPNVLWWKRELLEYTEVKKLKSLSKYFKIARWPLGRLTYSSLLISCTHVDLSYETKRTWSDSWRSVMLKVLSRLE